MMNHKLTYTLTEACQIDQNQRNIKQVTKMYPTVTENTWLNIQLSKYIKTRRELRNESFLGSRLSNLISLQPTYQRTD
jgi:hypothetical protein